MTSMFLYSMLLYFRLFCKEVERAWQPFSRDEQDTMFEKIYVLFREIMNVEVSGEILVCSHAMIVGMCDDSLCDCYFIERTHHLGNTARRVAEI